MSSTQSVCGPAAAGEAGRELEAQRVAPEAPGDELGQALVGDALVKQEGNRRGAVELLELQLLARAGG